MRVGRDGGALGGLHDHEAGAVEAVLDASPLPPRSIELTFMLLTTLGVRFADQHTAACGSTNVGCCEQSRISGSPSAVSATVPWPCTSVLNSPPDIMPAPLVRWTSHSRVASKASRLRPLMLMPSPSSSTRKISAASRAKNTSPCPATRISGVSSLRHRTAHELAQAARALVVEGHRALEGDHRALGAQHVGAERDPQHPFALEHPALGGLLLLMILGEEVGSHRAILTHPRAAVFRGFGPRAYSASGVT